MHASFRELSGLPLLLARLEAELDAAEAAPRGAPVPYARRLLLKALLRMLGAAAHVPVAGGWHPSEQESARLDGALVRVFGRAGDYGGGLFALAASTATATIHHNPLRYR